VCLDLEEYTWTISKLLSQQTRRRTTLKAGFTKRIFKVSIPSMISILLNRNFYWYECHQWRLLPFLSLPKSRLISWYKDRPSEKQISHVKSIHSQSYLYLVIISLPCCKSSSQRKALLVLLKAWKLFDMSLGTSEDTEEDKTRIHRQCSLTLRWKTGNALLQLIQYLHRIWWWWGYYDTRRTLIHESTGKRGIRQIFIWLWIYWWWKLKSLSFDFPSLNPSV
jgi:hypothetical protein